MTQPFQYNTYVRSQIGGEQEYDSHERSHLRSTVQHHQGPFHSGSFRPIDEAPSKASIKSKFNELLDLCKSENIDINSEFKNVLGAEKDILEMLRSQFSRQTTPGPHQNYNNQYVRSNVQNFPTSYTDYASAQGYFNQPTHDDPQSQANYQSQHQNYEQQYYQQPQAYQSQQQNYQQQDKNTFLRSKIQDLAQENRQLRQYASQADRPEDDPQIMELQREISKLRALIPQYEAQIAKMGSPMSKQRLMQLLEQGQRIRQDTIAMLRNQGSGEEEAQFLAQLENLRRRCKQLEDENVQLKRMSKGTQYTSVARNYY